MPELIVQSEGVAMSVVNVLKQSGLTASTSEALRMLAQGLRQFARVCAGRRGGSSGWKAEICQGAAQLTRSGDFGRNLNILKFILTLCLVSI